MKGAINMLQSFVQFLNVGFGIINNIEPVEAWDSDAAMERALALDNPQNDVRIIGFRFYDMDTSTNVIEKQSGIYYMFGELYTYPKIDPDVSGFIKNAGMNFEDGKQLIKIEKPNLMVYAFHDNDTLLDTEKAMAKIKIQRETERMNKMDAEITEYKTKLLEAIDEIRTAIENNKYNSIALAEIDTLGEKRALNVLEDNGNFGMHIEHLRKLRIEMLTIEKFIKDSQKDE